MKTIGVSVASYDANIAKATLARVITISSIFKSTQFTCHIFRRLAQGSPSNWMSIIKAEVVSARKSVCAHSVVAVAAIRKIFNVSRILTTGSRTN